MSGRLDTPLARAWQAAGIKPTQLADKVRVSLTHIYDLAAGRRNPSARVLAELCAFFDATPAELFPHLFGGRKSA